MSFLAPWFLVGILAVALPLWLHRLQTKNPKRRPFSSAMLLEVNEQRLHVQKSLRYLLLLALRIALLLLLALAFAKPLWQRPPAMMGAGPARLHLIMVDTSLSMSAGDRFARALAEARRLVDALPSGDRAEIVSAADTIDLVAGPTNDRAALTRALAGLHAGAGRLDFGAAVASFGGLAGTTGMPVVAHLISDFQESALPSRFGDLTPKPAPNRSLALQLHPIAAAAEPNWRVEAIRRSSGGVDVTVRALHARAEPRTVVLQVNGEERGRLTQPTPAEGTAVFHFDGIALRNGDNRVVARLEPPDALTLDDSRYAVLQNSRSEAVPALTADVQALGFKYLAAAFSAAGDRYHVEVAQISGFDARTLERYRWLVIDDLGAVDAALAARLRTFLENGGAIFAALGERAAALKTLPIGGEAVTASSTADEPVGVGQLDGAHPLLATVSGWEALTIARMLAVKPGAEDRVLIAASDGQPLLLERHVGRGRLLILTSSLNNDWNDLPVQPVFVGFMAQMADYLAGRNALGREQLVGATLPLAAAGESGGQVIDPQGRTVLSLADTRRARSVKLSQAGFYQVYTPTQEALIAVNSDPRESDTAVMDAAVLARWRAAATAAAQTAASSSTAAIGGTRTPLELWRYLLPLLVLIVLAESLLGNTYLRRDARGTA